MQIVILYVTEDSDFAIERSTKIKIVILLDLISFYFIILSALLALK